MRPVRCRDWPVFYAIGASRPVLPGNLLASPLPGLLAIMQDRGHMSAFRDGLPDDATRARFDAAMDDFAQGLATAHDQLMERYETGGAMAVARAAFVPGGPSVDELAAGWERIVAEARERQREAAA